MLKIKNLWVKVQDKMILKGIDMEIPENEIHAIMGPNGTGKSTLAEAIMGNPEYEIVKGEILLDGEDVLKMTVDERSRKGIFLAMQYPMEISGVTNTNFIRKALEARGEKLNLLKFYKTIDDTAMNLKMDPNLPHRYVNEGFSGGERKRNEIFQMQMLNPKIAIFDEIDSGLDVDALHIVADAINSQIKKHNFSALLITHYERFLNYINVDKVHVIVDGHITLTGGSELIKKIDKEGYGWLGVEEKKPIRESLGSCALNKKNG